MLKYITVCDDSEADIASAREVILDTAKTLREPVEFDFCIDAAGVERKILQKHEQVDILILDIDMPGISGLELARRLREENKDTLIIFLSAHEEFVFQAFEFQPFRYIRKLCLQTEMPVALASAFKVLKQKESCQLVFRTADGTMRQSLAEILYIESNRHYLSVHLADGDAISARQNISDVQAMIPPDRFVMIHRSCLVNIEHIRNIENGILILENGEKLVISRSRYKDVKQKLLQVWGDLL